MVDDDNERLVETVKLLDESVDVAVVVGVRIDIDNGIIVMLGR